MTYTIKERAIDVVKGAGVLALTAVELPMVCVREATGLVNKATKKVTDKIDKVVEKMV